MRADPEHGTSKSRGERRSLPEEVVEIDLFLKETASREANAKVRLQQFIEELLDRADRAEKQLQIISSCGSTPNGSLGRCSIPGYKAQEPRVQGPRQRIERHQGPGSSTHGSYPVSNQRSSSCTGVAGRVKTVSQSSGCYDSDGGEPVPMDESLDHYSGNNQPEDSSFERNNNRSSGLRRQAIQNWHRRPYRNSTEGEEGDISDAGSQATESEAEVWEQDSIGSAELNSERASGDCRPKGRCDGRMLRPEKGSPSRANEVISPEILKMRAALFCIFTYLDTKTLLRAAEVSRDWKFVARHPAVWTRVFLENTRVSPKFLLTLSQWCTQTHSLTLQNLKPRQRGKKETKEEYMKSTRGCLEAGLEALLKATGGNLLILRISHCPNILTDRSLWLASCYCRALQAVTY
ncbi:PREDICTED: F-box only protein 41-like, partial [Nanorana parkeri]|uniref:F-box only protein 41-like n=1 Tax=Nanorana parkeri TaxID=125878 RepID=UPI000854D6AC